MTATASFRLEAIAYDDAAQGHEAWNPEAAPTRAYVGVSANRESEGLIFPTLTVEVATREGYTSVRLTPSQARKLAVAMIEAAAVLDLSNQWPDWTRHEPDYKERSAR